MYISNAFNFGQIDSIHGDLRGYDKDNQYFSTILLLKVSINGIGEMRVKKSISCDLKRDGREIYTTKSMSHFLFFNKILTQKCNFSKEDGMSKMIMAEI